MSEKNKSIIDYIYDVMSRACPIGYTGDKKINGALVEEIERLRKLVFNVKENGYHPKCGCVRCDGIREAIYDMIGRGAKDE